MTNHELTPYNLPFGPTETDHSTQEANRNRLETESMIAKAIENENEVTKVLENSKRDRNLNRQKELKDEDQVNSNETPKKKPILARQNSFKSVKKFFQVLK